MTAEQPDLLDMLEALVEGAAQHGLPRVHRVHADPVRGHIALQAPDADPERPFFALVDLGPVLRAWTGQGADIDPAAAIEFGKALVAWGEARS